MVLNDLSHQREPKTDTFATFTCAACTVERFEYALAFIFWYARAAVFDREQYAAAGYHRLCPDYASHGVSWRVL